MAYATAEDVQKLAPHLPAFSPSSKPSYDDVVSFIADIETGLNAVLGAIGYTVPIAGAEALKVLKVMVAHAALAMVLRARAYGSNNPGDIAAADRAQAHYDSWLKLVRSPGDPTVLPGETISGAGVEKDRVDIATTLSNPSRSECYPVLTRDMVF